MNELNMTFEEAVSDYRDMAQRLYLTECTPDKNSSEKMRDGGWILRDYGGEFLTVIDGSVFNPDFAFLPVPWAAGAKKINDETLVALVSNGETFDFKFDDERLSRFPRKEVIRLLKLLQRHSKRYIEMDAARRKYDLAHERWLEVYCNDDYEEYNQAYGQFLKGTKPTDDTERK